MENLRIFTGNRLEGLAVALAGVLRSPLKDPVEPEIIVVQSKGMEHWISMQMARRHGICANYRFPFPRAFIQDLCRIVLHDLPATDPYDPRILAWRITKILRSMVSQPEFEHVRHYLGEAPEDLRRFQLSYQIADLFDQYMLFRPEMIDRWESGEHTHWQAVLWRALVAENGRTHRPALMKVFFEKIQDLSIDDRAFPERVTVFGISALPPVYIRILAALSRYSRVNLFLMNPCREYWGDILTDWESGKAIRRHPGRAGMTETLHLEQGNRLLASMGRLGREFFDLLQDFSCEERYFFEDPGKKSLLCNIQSDILNLIDRPPGGGEKTRISEDDASIQFHSCHSPMREVEVLQDRLLRILDDDPALRPGDILVMMPDIDAYAPFIQAVFDIETDDQRRLPFSIADRSVRSESEIIEAFLAVIDIGGGRFGAAEVMGLLELDPIGRKFDLTEDDFVIIRRWINGTRIRWGLDAEMRSRMGLPGLPDNTWRAGLDRLLLGYAMPGEGERLFDGILPYDHVEGEDARLLGIISEFVVQLDACVQEIGLPHTLVEWADILNRWIDRFLMPDEDSERGIQILRSALHDLGQVPANSAFHDKVDIHVLKWHLKRSLERTGFGFGFITGGVTFAAMLPMRSIPFRVICLMGMNHDAYPRDSVKPGFDLMAGHPEPGDRSRRNDDRYLFLEALLSARDLFYISYVGQSILDNSPITPSVLVSELMEYIEQGFDSGGGGAIHHLLTHHRLQAFNPAYFTGSEKWLSYSEENCRAAQAMISARHTPRPFIDAPLKTPDEQWRVIDLNDLCRFFTNPVKYLMTRRLGVWMDEGTTILEEREAFQLKGLEKFQLEQDLLEKRLGGRHLQHMWPVIHASGQLPPGACGRVLYEGISGEIERFAGRTSVYIEGRSQAPLDLDISLSGFRITGYISDIYRDRLVKCRYARIKPRDRLIAWIHHLALSRMGGAVSESLLIGLDPKQKEESVWMGTAFGPVNDDVTLLKGLLDIYWTGLCWPVHFFPEASWVYASGREKGMPEEDALPRARKIWEGNHFQRGECEDEYYRVCFRGMDPLDKTFRDLAEKIFFPLMAHETEGFGVME